jgi:ubiquinone/menaquinone biosynthesis C-methylase UbiE
MSRFFKIGLHAIRLNVIRLLSISLLLTGMLILPGYAAADTPPTSGHSNSGIVLSPPDVYRYRKPSFDGTGKIYRRREISEVMGHQGAAWLERRDREQEENPNQLIESLSLNPTDVVADIGAGTGYISFRLAPFVAQGKVLAIDVQPKMIDILRERISKTGVRNIQPILGTEQDPHLPLESVDLAILVDAYHEFSYPQEIMTAVVKALKPGGKVALVEYREEDPLVFIKPHHKMTQIQAKKEMKAIGLTWRETRSSLPQQHLMIFQK